MKKIISVFLTVIILVCALPLAVCAEEGDYAYDTEYYSKLSGQDITLYVYN